MNIDILHYASPPIVGGVESVIGHHARLFADDGHNVRILAGRGEQFDPRIDFIHLPLIDSRHEQILEIKNCLDKGELPDEFKSIKKQIYSNLSVELVNTQILIAHNVCSLSKNLPLTAAIYHLTRDSTDIRYILWQHDLAWTSSRYQSELHPGYPWNLLREKWEGVEYIVVSKVRQKEMVDLYGIDIREVQVVPNGLSVSKFLKLESETLEFIKKLRLYDAAPLLLLPVRITTRKNIEFAIQVVKSLLDYYPKSVLLITGPLGPHNPANIKYFNKLRKLRKELDIINSVHFLAEYSDEFIPDEVISDLYQISDALFIPSREEGFGIPILEAGLIGIPIICSDIPPLRELGGEHATYFSISSSPSSVAGKIVSRMKAEVGFSMRVHVRQQYTWEQIYKNKIVPLIGE